MPGHGVPQVKCETPSESEDEDSNIQSYQRPTTVQLRPVKQEPEESSVEGDAPTNLLRHLQSECGLEELGGATPAAPAATPVTVKQELDTRAATLQTLQSAPLASSSLHMERHLTMISSSEMQSSEFMPLMPVKDEPMSEGEQAQLSGDDTSDSCSGAAESVNRTSPKSWTQQDMELALEALRKHNMSLTKASATYGIPSTTLWQRAHRLGIDTPKKEGSSKSWSEVDLRAALHALRAGAISANKASKAYGIPSSTLYKIARREGIRLAAPFNAAPTSWRPSDLERALQSIRSGHNSVQRASAQFGIPTGTLYGRCKREGIELSRSNPTPWSEDAMGEALEAVRVGQMSINQAAIHYNLPYSSLYGRFKRCKYPQGPHLQQQGLQDCPEIDLNNQQNQDIPYHQYPQHHVYQPEQIDHTNLIHYHQNPMQHLPDHRLAHIQNPSMVSNAILNEQYSGQAMYYSQAHTTHTHGITTS